MKIKSIECLSLHQPPHQHSGARRSAWVADAEVANPMSKFSDFKRYRSSWLPAWPGFWVKVTAEDGSYGLGPCSFGRPTAAVIQDHFAKLLVGQDALATELLWDMMFRMSKPYGTVGL
ncbi:MAG: hypothetical protein ACYC6L_15965, partial [Anaerolineae bacterium]